MTKPLIGEATNPIKIVDAIRDCFKRKIAEKGQRP